MTTLSAEDSVFVAGCPLQLATGDHPLVAIVEPERIVVVSVPEGILLAEIGLREEAEGVDVAWLGTPPRLLVVSRLPDATVLHLLDVPDPHDAAAGGGTGAGGSASAPAGTGVRLCSEKRVDASLRLIAVNASYGLLAGSTSMASSAAILTRTDDNISIHPVAARGIPSAAGALGTQLIAAFTGVIEIWDPVARVAKRRLKLPRPTQIRGVGGSDRQIWLTTVPEPQRLEVLPLVNRGQPLAHELPEPISSVASHPKLDVVVCAGADSGHLYVVDLDGRVPTRRLGSELFGGRPMSMSLIGGRVTAIVAVASDQPARVVHLDGSPLREWPAPPPPPLVHLEPQVPLVPYLRPANRASSPAISTGGQGGVPGGAGAAGSSGAAGPAGGARPAGAPAAAAGGARPAGAPAAVAGGVRPGGAPVTNPDGTPAAGQGAPAARIPGISPTAAPAPTVFDSKLGHAVAAPSADEGPAPPRATIIGAATTIARAPRPGTRDESSAAIALPAEPAPQSPLAGPTDHLLDRLQSWRERTDASALGAPDASADGSSDDASDDEASSLDEAERADDDAPRIPEAREAPAPWPSRPSAAPHTSPSAAPHTSPSAAPHTPPSAAPHTPPSAAPHTSPSAAPHTSPSPGARAIPPTTSSPPSATSSSAATLPSSSASIGGSGSSVPGGAIPEDSGSPAVASTLASSAGPSRSASAPSASDRAEGSPGRSPLAAAASALADVISGSLARAERSGAHAQLPFAPSAEAQRDWRMMLIEWTRARRAGLVAPPPALAPPLAHVIGSLALAPPLAPALQLLYGAHLLGEGGVAPAEVFALLGESLAASSPAQRWREALGTGSLAAVGATGLCGSRLRLPAELRRFLDERPAKHGLIFGSGGAPRTTPAAVVCDPLTVDPFRLAAAAGGAVLLGSPPPASSADLRGAALEARLRGATAAFPYPRSARHPGLDPIPDLPALYLVPSIEIAAATGFELVLL